MSDLHGELKSALHAKIGALPYCRLWSQATGVARALADDHMVAFGVRGGGDLSGILMPDGRRLEIEVKTGAAVPSKRQKAFRAMVERFGGLYLLVRARTPDEVAGAVEAAAAAVLRAARERGLTPDRERPSVKP